MKDLTAIRTEYALAGLQERDVDPSPIAQLDKWLRDAIAAEHPEPTAMTLATASPDGEPAARIVLLKGLDERGLVFFTGYESDKGRQLAANPRACACFFWVHARAAGARHRQRLARAPRRDRGVLPVAPAREPARRVGVARRAASSRAGASSRRASPRCARASSVERGPVPAAVGRLSPRPGSPGAMAGPTQPPPRSLAIYTHERTRSRHWRIDRLSP